MRDLVSERRNPRTTNIDQLSTLQILATINEEDRMVAHRIEKELPHIANATETFVGTLKKGGRVFYVGAGTSGRLGVLDAAELISTFGLEEGRVQAIVAGGSEAMFRPVLGAEDDEQGGERAILKAEVGEGDFVIGISASGRTAFVIGAMRKARELGAKTAIISVNPECEAASYADIGITPVVGEEVIAGSTRMKAGTAEKMILTMMSTAAMIRLGRVKSNLMIDLKPVSRKMVERAKRIVMSEAGVSYEKASKLLEMTNFNIRDAIARAKRGDRPAQSAHG